MSTPEPSFLAGLRLESAPLSDEEKRKLLEQRIALFAMVHFATSISFLVLANVMAVALSPIITARRVLGLTPNWLHLAGALLAGAAWLVARRGGYRPSTLGWLDIASSLLPMIAYGGMMNAAAAITPERVDLVLMLVTIVLLTTRATLVPSTPRQTALVGFLACAPTVALAMRLGLELGDRETHFAAPLYVVFWCVLAVVITTLASRVNYGLRAKAAEAQRLGQYVLSEKIGEGGMGIVYRGNHALLRRPTALKLLPLDKVGANALQRFEREVQLTSRLTHPNTVAIFDYGRTPEGVFYYAMEYLEGIDLQKLVDQHGAQGPSRVVHVLAQVCGSLAEAHAAGLVHRDIKPANVILCERGGIQDTVKVVDFGLVKDLGSGPDPALTNANAIIGTPAYIAPETVLAPEQVDGRADLYAVGCVAYFLLTGQTVFQGDSVVELCTQHLHQEPTPPSARLGKSLPPELERIVLACLAKKRDERPPSAHELRAALLACPIPRWTDQDARRWWAEHPLGSGPPPGMPSATVLTIDLTQRADEQSP